MLQVMNEDLVDADSISNVLENTWNIKDLNPEYKSEDKTYTDEDGNPLPTVG